MMDDELHLEFCGELLNVPADRPFTIGRDADFVIDENPFLHRRFLELSRRSDMWWIANTGGQLSATVSDGNGRFQAWLAPQAHLPLVFQSAVVRFTAGPTSYELCLQLGVAPYTPSPMTLSDSGETTLGLLVLTEEQRLLIVALAEPALRREGGGRTELPSSAMAANRLGWPLTKFNRKLDNVCQKLKRAGVRGLHGGPDHLASDRRARLVEYSLAVRLVTHADLGLLG